MFPFTWVALNWLEGPFTKELNAWSPLSGEGALDDGMMNCPLALACMMASATGPTFPAVMQAGPLDPQPSAAFTRFARLAGSRLVSVKPCSVGTPLKAPLRA